jgi:hypothetical protein
VGKVIVNQPGLYLKIPEYSDDHQDDAKQQRNVSNPLDSPEFFQLQECYSAEQHIQGSP